MRHLLLGADDWLHDRNLTFHFPSNPLGKMLKRCARRRHAMGSLQRLLVAPHVVLGKRQGHVEEGAKKDDKVAGSYGMAKAKQNSENLRRAMRGVRRTGSILLIISQTRDSLYGKTRGGGRALRFYSTVEVWTKPVGKITKTVLGKEREVGTRVEFKTVKNRITGRLYSVELEIYPNLGIDDLGACVDYLVEEGKWGIKDKTLTGTLVGDGTREKVIKLIERRGLEGKVRELCGKVWAEVEAAMALKRKNRYTGV